MSYKTFEDMKHDIPEGATHYHSETEMDYFAWVKNEGGDMLCLMPDSAIFNHWHVRKFDDVKSIPQTETPEEKEASDSMANNSELPNSSEWDGEGLPPVGCVVLGLFHSDITTIEKWHIDYISESVGVYTEVKSGEQYMFATKDVSLRKPETPQQREERERLEEIGHMARFIKSLPPTVKMLPDLMAEKLYDANYRKAK